jgi:putative ABC transport system substrate-binding protein
MKRRAFIAGLGSAAAWPVVARAQQADRIRRVVVLVNGAENDQAIQRYVAAFREGMAKLGWLEEHNFRIDVRFGGGNIDSIRANAAEMVNVAPDVIVTGTAAVTKAVQQQTQTIPIVITAVGDPVANGIVTSLTHPEGNTTGLTNLFFSIGGKWLQLLTEAAPRVERVALIYNFQLGISAYLASIEDAARHLAVTVTKMPYRNALDIVRAIDAFGVEPNGALIVMPPPPTASNRETIVRLAMQYGLPSIDQARRHTTDGGLMAYGPDNSDIWRRAASYVDRILRGTKVNELPVEFPTKFELSINLKTAKALGLTIPETLLATADEVIQ